MAQDLRDLMKEYEPQTPSFLLGTRLVLNKNWMQYLPKNSGGLISYGFELPPSLLWWSALGMPAIGTFLSQP